jgi:hypothetical protein
MGTGAGTTTGYEAPGGNKPFAAGRKKGAGIDVTAHVAPGGALMAAAAAHKSLQAQAAAYRHPQSLPQGYGSDFGAGGGGQPLGPAAAPREGNRERLPTPNMLPRRRPPSRSGAAISR